MKISEVISELERQKNEHGDLEVRYCDNDMEQGSDYGIEITGIGYQYFEKESLVKPNPLSYIEIS
jgi:hypothetical protein